MTITADTITAALRKLGPVSPGHLADHLEVEQPALGYHLKKMLDAGELKATGKSKARRIALPDQKFDDAETPTPPQRRQKATKRKGKKRSARKAEKRSPAAAPKREAEPPVAALTTDFRIVVFNPSGVPTILTELESEKVAEICHQFFESARP